VISFVAGSTSDSPIAAGRGRGHRDPDHVGV